MSLLKECKPTELRYKISIDDLPFWITKRSSIPNSLSNSSVSSEDVCYIELCEKSFIQIIKQIYPLDKFGELHISLYHSYDVNDDIDHWFYSKWLSYLIDMEKAMGNLKVRQDSFSFRSVSRPDYIKERIQKTETMLVNKENTSNKTYRLYLGRISFDSK